MIKLLHLFLLLPTTTALPSSGEQYIPNTSSHATSSTSQLICNDPFSAYWDEIENQAGVTIGAQHASSSRAPRGLSLDASLKVNEVINDDMLPSGNSDMIAGETDNSDEYNDVQILPPRPRSAFAPPTEKYRERRRKAYSRHEQKLMQRETPYWQTLCKDRPDMIRLLTDRLMAFGDLSDKGAKLHLRLNIDPQIEADLLSNDLYREQRAVHMLDYGVLDDTFTHAEKKMIKESMKSEGVRYDPRFLSQARKHLTPQQRLTIRRI